ncbi:MAG: histidine phosphatase family protein [Marinibacterium sp.]|nr:histidine phosphatase family protein [Marinibacterium sp.]
MSQEFRQSRYRAPSGAADLLLIRHGESMPYRPGEPFPVTEGHGDPALHPDGHLQAERVADRLQDDPIAAIYVTTLQRTHQTAAPLAARLGLDPRIEADLREIHLGDWDTGLYRQKAAARDPAFVRAMEHGEWGEIPGAETTEAFSTRVAQGLARIASSHAGDRVAAFVHGGVIAAAMALATGSRPMAFMGAANGSISRLVIHGPRQRVVGFNDIAHLGDLA